MTHQNTLLTQTQMCPKGFDDEHLQVISGGGENRTPVRNRVMQDAYTLSRPIGILFFLLSATKIRKNQPAEFHLKFADTFETSLCK